MMSLSVHAQKFSQRQAQVFWYIGQERKGILNISFDFESEEFEIIAELVAIRHLIFEKLSFEVEPFFGKGYRLAVSRGAIKKLFRGTSSKAFAGQFAAFLKIRMEEAVIEVDRWLDKFGHDKESWPQETIEASYHQYSSPHTMIETPVLGKIFITQHAIEQFRARHDSADEIRAPLASLVQRLKHPNMAIELLPESVLEQKKRRYGRADNIQALRHPDSQDTFLILTDESGDKNLVTVFGQREKLKTRSAAKTYR